METYSWFRAFADSWMLLAMVLFYVGVIVWVFRPSARKDHADSARIPLRNDTPGHGDAEARAHPKKTEMA